MNLWKIAAVKFEEIVGFERLGFLDNHDLQFGIITDMIWVSHVFEDFKSADKQVSAIELQLR